MKSPQRRFVIALAAAAALVGMAGPTWAQSAKDFYKGKTVTFVVGFGAGGGFDTLARVLAPHIATRIGGTVIVENRTGAGGTSALNQMVRGNQDGTEIDIVHGVAALLSQLTDRPGRRFDVEKFQWLGRISSEPGAVLTSAKSPYSSIEDLEKSKRPIKFAAGSTVDSLSDFAAVFCEALQLKCKIITGYKGAKESSLAAIRGEADAMAVEANTAAIIAEGGELKPIVVLSRKRWHTLPDTPTIFEAAKVPDERAWLIDFRSSVNEVGRAVAMGPDVSKDKVDYMREVLKSVLTDPKVVAEIEKIGREVDYLSGADEKQIVDKVMKSVQGEKLDEIKYLFLKKYF